MLHISQRNTFSSIEAHVSNIYLSGKESLR